MEDAVSVRSHEGIPDITFRYLTLTVDILNQVNFILFFDHKVTLIQ